MTNGNDFFTVDDIQQLTGQSYRDTLALFKFGLIPAAKRIGMNYIVNKDSFLDWAKENNINIINNDELPEESMEAMAGAVQ